MGILLLFLQGAPADSQYGKKREGLDAVCALNIISKKRGAEARGFLSINSRFWIAVRASILFWLTRRHFIHSPDFSVEDGIRTRIIHFWLLLASLMSLFLKRIWGHAPRRTTFVNSGP